MSTAGQIKLQLRQDIQHELTTANQLIRLIHAELQVIKSFTNPGGEFDTNIKHNSSLIKSLADHQKIDLTKIPPMARKCLDVNKYGHQNGSHKEHNSERSGTGFDESLATHMQI